MIASKEGKYCSPKMKEMIMPGIMSEGSVLFEQLCPGV